MGFRTSSREAVISRVLFACSPTDATRATKRFTVARYASSASWTAGTSARASAPAGSSSWMTPTARMVQRPSGWRSALRSSQMVPTSRVIAPPPTSGPSTIMLTTNRPPYGEPSATRSCTIARYRSSKMLSGRGRCGKRTVWSGKYGSGIGRSILVDEGHVDLGALKLPGVIDVHALPLAEEVERRLADLAMAVAGGLGAAEWQVGLGPDGSV